MMRHGAFLLATALLLVVVWMLYAALAMHGGAGRVPVVILVPTVVALLVQWGLDLRRELREGSIEFLTSRELGAAIIVVGVVAAAELLGLAIGVSLCLLLLLTLRAKVAVPKAAIAAFATFLTIDQGIRHGMGMLLPEGRLWVWLGL